MQHKIQLSQKSTGETENMEPVTIAAGALITQIVKSGYEKWLDGQTESLALTDDAKGVLTQMQSDPTDNGVFVDTTSLGSSGVEMANPYASGEEINTTRRVIAELEAKGLVETVVRYDREGRERKDFRLTHFGWILNAGTGQADKIG